MKIVLKSLIAFGMLAATPALALTGDATFNAELLRIATTRGPTSLSVEAGTVAPGRSNAVIPARSGARRGAVR
jgi:hypothetical protein